MVRVDVEVSRLLFPPLLSVMHKAKQHQCLVEREKVMVKPRMTLHLMTFQASVMMMKVQHLRSLAQVSSLAQVTSL